MRTVETPPDVERVVDGQDYYVEVRFDPRDLLPQVLEALGSSALALGQAARWRNANSFAARKDAMDTLTRICADREAFVVRLAGGTAEDLSVALDEHCTEPNRCIAADCENYAIDKASHCAPHVDSYPCAGIRA